MGAFQAVSTLELYTPVGDRPALSGYWPRSMPSDCLESSGVLDVPTCMIELR